jgi:hypothetical protein
MRKSRRPERRLAGRTAIDLPAPSPCHRPVVLDRQFHEEVVRVLAIVDGVAVAGFAGSQQVGVAAAGDRPRLETGHRPQPEASRAQRPPRHRHAPVDAAGLVRAAMQCCVLVDELRECLAVQHQLPVAGAAMQGVHRREIGLPRGAGRVAGGEQRPGHGGVIVLRVLRRGCGVAGMLAAGRRRRGMLMVLRLRGRSRSQRGHRQHGEQQASQH